MTDTHQFGDALQVWEEWPALSADERCERCATRSSAGRRTFPVIGSREQGTWCSPAHTGTAALDSPASSGRRRRI